MKSVILSTIAATLLLGAAAQADPIKNFSRSNVPGEERINSVWGYSYHHNGTIHFATDSTNAAHARKGMALVIIDAVDIYDSDAVKKWLDANIGQ